jgi:hypothetical protein
MIKRRLNRSQIPQLVSEIKAGKIYAVRGQELTGESVDLYVLKGKPRKGDREARLSAWQAGKDWLAEVGEIREERGYYFAKSAD